MALCRISIKSNGKNIFEDDLDVGDYFIGRSKSCDIIIDDPAISRRHLKLQVDEAGVTVENLSSHGTLFGDQAIPPGFHLLPGASIRLSKTVTLTRAEERKDPEETILASQLPESVTFLEMKKSEKTVETAVKGTDESFFEEPDVDMTFATDVMKTRIVQPDEMKQLRHQDMRRKRLKIGGIALALVAAAIGLTVLYNVNFFSGEEQLSWPCDSNGEWLIRSVDTLPGSSSQSQFSVIAPYIEGKSHIDAKADHITIHTWYGKNGNVPLRIVFRRNHGLQNLHKTLKTLFSETLSELQKKGRLMTYSGLSDLCYIGDDNGVPCYLTDYTAKDQAGKAWYGNVIAFRNGCDYYLRFVEVPLSERSRASDFLSSLPFLKFSPSYIETVWNGVETMIPGSIDELVEEINKNLSKQNPFEWHRTYLMITTLLASAMERRNQALEKQGLDFLRVFRRQQKKWFNNQRRNYYLAEEKRKDTKYILELCKTVFSSPNDYRYQMLRRNRWE